MRSVETSGADIEEAIEKGLKMLDVARENVIVEIVEEPSRGVLGLGSKEAIVRLTTVVPPRSEREKFVSAAVETSGEDEIITTPPPSESDEFRSRRPERRPRRDRDTRRGNQNRGDDRRRHGGRSRRDDVDRKELESIEPRRQTEPVTDDDQIPEGVRVGAETLGELLDQMGVTAEIAIERVTVPGVGGDEDEGDIEIPWLLHIHGDDVGMLIGRRGETLGALQYLTRLIASRDIQSRAEFSVDVEDYRARREIQLERIAERKAKEAVRRNRTVLLEPMSPNERRIVHMSLRDNPDVYTESTGEGQRRRVTIVPKNNGQE